MEQTLIGETSFHTCFRWIHAKKGDGDFCQNWQMQSNALPKWDWCGQRSGNDCQGAGASHPLSDLIFQWHEDVIPMTKLFEERDGIGGQSGTNFVAVNRVPRRQIRLGVKSAGKEVRRAGEMLAAPLLRAPNFFFWRLGINVNS